MISFCHCLRRQSWNWQETFGSNQVFIAPLVQARHSLEMVDPIAEAPLTIQGIRWYHGSAHPADYAKCNRFQIRAQGLVERHNSKCTINQMSKSQPAGLSNTGTYISDVQSIITKAHVCQQRVTAACVKCFLMRSVNDYRDWQDYFLMNYIRYGVNSNTGTNSTATKRICNTQPQQHKNTNTAALLH